MFSSCHGPDGNHGRGTGPRRGYLRPTSGGPILTYRSDPVTTAPSRNRKQENQNPTNAGRCGADALVLEGDTEADKDMRCSADQRTSLRPWQVALSVWRRVEDVSSGIVAFIVAVVVIFTSVIIGFERTPSGPIDGAFRYGLMTSICAMELLHIRCLVACSHKRPYSPQVALAMPRFPIAIRPVASVFWGIHLLFALGFVWIAHAVPPSVPVLLHVAAFVGGGLCSFWAFGYLLLVIASVKRDDGLLKPVWRHRSWYLLVIAGVAFALPYTGFVSIVRYDVFLTTPKKVMASTGSGAVSIDLAIRNAGDEPTKVIADASWAHFLAEVRVPSGATFRLRPLPLLQSLQRTREQYQKVPANSSQQLCQLQFIPGEVLGMSSDWQSPEGTTPSRVPFLEGGSYRIKLTYRDRAGAQYGALSRMPPVVFTVVID